MNRIILSTLCFLTAWTTMAATGPVVEVEEQVYRFEPADNGAGPMWCHGSTCLGRVGELVFASGSRSPPRV